MRELVRTCAFACSLLLFPAVSSGATTFDTELTMLPGNHVSTQDEVFARVDGFFGTAGYKMYQDPSVSIVNDRIEIEFFFLRPDGVAAQVITPFSATARIGQLPVGTYAVDAEFAGRLAPVPMTENLTVSAVPLPPALWLFASGLFALFSTRRMWLMTGA